MEQKWEAIHAAGNNTFLLNNRDVYLDMLTDSGVRGIKRDTLSEQRDENGNETFSNMELLRLALLRRVFPLSQMKYAIDRIVWLYEN